MQIHKTLRVIAILIVFINANTTISNESYQIDNNANRIIDDKTIKTDNIYIDSNSNKEIKNGLVMDKDISQKSNNNGLQESTITSRNGYFSVLQHNAPSTQIFTPQSRKVLTQKPVDVITNAHRAKIIVGSKDAINSDLVINYAAIDSELMNIEPIKTNGKVILIVSPEVNNNTKQYDMINVNSAQLEIESKSNGISLTSTSKKYDKNKEAPEKIQIHNLDGASISIKKFDETSLRPIERRQYVRFKISEIASPVVMQNDNETFELIDISRGGVAIKTNNKNLKEGSIMPVNIKYKDANIKTNIKVLSMKDSRVNAKFINEDKSTEDKLLYLSVLLESDNNMLKTKLSNK